MLQNMQHKSATYFCRNFALVSCWETYNYNAHRLAVKFVPDLDPYAAGSLNRPITPIHIQKRFGIAEKHYIPYF